ALKAVKGPDLDLHEVIADLFESSKVSEKRIQEIVKLSKSLQDAIRRSFKNDRIKVEISGSYASGLCQKNSDAEFTVMDPSDVIKSAVAIGGVMAGRGGEGVALMAARVPITIFFDPQA
ncbi:hypothetical protein BGZ83_004064, partial [Gryganskiella cystojenkinii]